MTPDPALGEIGRQLAGARCDRQLSIDDLSRRTKIAVPFLEAIERGDARALPGSFYIRSFLRAIAHEVGCDGEDIVRRFRAATGDRDIELKELVENRERAHPAPPPAFEPRRRWATQAAGLLVLIAGSWYVASGMEMPRLTRARRASPAVAAATMTVPAATPEHPRLPVTGVAPVATSGDRNPAALTLDVAPSAECWLSATADGERVFYQLLNAGERARIQARTDLELRIGDAGAFAFMLNGQTGKSLGMAGEAVSVHLTPQNYRQFLIP